MRCHSRQPLIIHARIPGHSALSSSARYLLTRSSGIVTANGMRLNRRVIALLTVRSLGMWLPSKQQLELRKEIEEILAHEARRDFVAAGQFLDARLRPAPALLGFGGGNQAGASSPASSVGCRSDLATVNVSIDVERW